MVENPVIVASFTAGIVALVSGVAESLHLKRVARVEKLIEVSDLGSTVFARISPALRVISLALSSWGLVILLLVPAAVVDVEPDPEASKHLLICLDASPSMFLEDAGPRLSSTSEPLQRMVRAGDVMKGLMDRIDGEKTRVTVFGVYTRAVPILEETFDKSVVNNLFDGLPIFAAFEQGETQLASSVSDAIEYSRKWPENSTLLLIVSDGDSKDGTPIRAVPNSIAEAALSYRFISPIPAPMLPETSMQMVICVATRSLSGTFRTCGREIITRAAVNITEGISVGSEYTWIFSR